MACSKHEALRARNGALADELAMADAINNALCEKLLELGVLDSDIEDLIQGADPVHGGGPTPPDESPPISLEGMPTDGDEVSQNITVRRLPVRTFRELGFLHEVNRLILHPCGLALEVVLDPKTGEESFSGVWDCTEDVEGVAYGEDYIDPVKADNVARFLESRGPARITALGYVIQPVSTDVAQLHVTIREPLRAQVGAPGEYDQGEEVQVEPYDPSTF